MGSSLFVSAFFVIVFFFISCCEARDSIDVGNPLIDDQTLVSARNRFELGFFTTEKGGRYVAIWYHKLVPRTVVWVSRRDESLPGPCEGIQIGDDGGNVEVLCGNEGVIPIILPGGSKASNKTLQLLDSGNLVILDAHSAARVWQSFDEPTDTFLPGMILNDTIRLSSWICYSEPSSGNYSFGQDQGIYEILQKPLATYWKSNERGSFMKNTLPFLVEQLLSRDSNVTSRLVMNSSGEIQYYSLSDAGSWSLLWLAPEGPCSKYNACGKFGVCNAEGKVMCECPPGFRPVSLEDWKGGRYSEGCERVISECSRRRSFFNITLARVGGDFKPFDQAQNETSCKETCLSECKCQAYYFQGTDPSSRETQTAGRCWIWMDNVINLHQDSMDGSISLSLRISKANSTTRICEPCGTTSSIPIPYPLSTGPSCGDPSYYSFDCNDTINFSTLTGKYQVAAIDKENRRFIILVGSKTVQTCNGRNSSSQVVSLNHSLPFTVTNWCYVKPIIGPRRVEIGWEPLLEPSCVTSSDYEDWPNSDCHDRGNGLRCYCRESYRWDGILANCSEALRNSGKESKRRNKIVGSIVVVGVILVSCSSYVFYLRKKAKQ